MTSKYDYLDFAEVVLSIGNTRGEGPVAPSLSLQTKVSPYAVTKWHSQTGDYLISACPTGGCIRMRIRMPS